MRQCNDDGCERKREDKVVCSDTDGTFSVQLERWERREMKAATRRKIPKDPQISTKRKRNFPDGTGRRGSYDIGQNPAPRPKKSEFRARGKKGLGLPDSSYYTIIVINLYRRSREWGENNVRQCTPESERRNRTQRARKRS